MTIAHTTDRQTNRAGVAEFGIPAEGHELVGLEWSPLLYAKKGKSDGTSVFVGVGMYVFARPVSAFMCQWVILGRPLSSCCLRVSDVGRRRRTMCVHGRRCLRASGGSCANSVRPKIENGWPTLSRGATGPTRGREESTPPIPVFKPTN